MTLLLAVLLSWAAPAAAGETVQIAVLHTNDVHGWIFAKPASWYAADPKRLIGGFPAAANVIKAEKLPKLLLDAGDWFQGTPEAALSRGAAALDCFNALPYDAVEIGNHDLDYGQAELERLARAHKVPVLGANIYLDDHSRPPYVTPWLVKEVAGVKIGVFGLLTRNMRELAFPAAIAGMRFRREADEARDMVRKLKAEGATVIVAVTHVGFLEPSMQLFEDDKFLAGEVPGIDLIVGGHTHTALKEPVRDPRNGTLIVQTGSYLSQLGRVELEIDKKTGKVVKSSGKLIDLWVDEVGENPAMKAIVRRYQGEADRRLSVVLATATATLSRSSRNRESSIGDWFTDCARESAHADVAIQNFKGIRADMPAGPVPVRRMWEIMPFDNHLATTTLTGAQLRETVERGVSGASGMFHVSGLKLRFAGSAKPGRRVREILVNGRPLDDASRYVVATTDFLMMRGDGYAELGHGEGTSMTGTLMRDLLVECARRAKVIQPPEAGRIIEED